MKGNASTGKFLRPFGQRYLCPKGQMEMATIELLYTYGETFINNTLEMSAVLKELVQEGYVLTKDELAALSPYQTQHIKRFGNYVIDLETLPQPIDDDELTALV